MDLSKYSKVFILRALYNSAVPIGLGRLHAKSGDLDPKVAEDLVAGKGHSDLGPSEDRTDGYFDYVFGRPLKIDLKDLKNFDPRLYERDNGSVLAAIERELKKGTKSD